MQEVRKSLRDAWNILDGISKSYNFKQGLNNSGMSNLASDLELLELAVHEARVQLPAPLDVVYAIAHESNVDEFEGFTHGPTPDLQAMLACAPEDGQVLVRITTLPSGGPDYQALKGYLDGQWFDC